MTTIFDQIKEDILLGSELANVSNLPPEHDDQQFYCFEADHRRRARVPKLERIALAAEKLAADLKELIAESDGVGGLHQNGDFAPWDELTAGGQFEDWLGSLHDFQEASK